MTTRDDIVEAGAKAYSDYCDDMIGWARRWGEFDPETRDEWAKQQDAALTAMLPLILAGVANEVLAMDLADWLGPYNPAEVRAGAARLIEGWTP